VQALKARSDESAAAAAAAQAAAAKLGQERVAGLEKKVAEVRMRVGPITQAS
jgi:hypothetical protein